MGPDSLATTVAPPRTPSSLCHDIKNFSTTSEGLFPLHAALHDPMEKDDAALAHPWQVAAARDVTQDRYRTAVHAKTCSHAADMKQNT